MRPAADGFLVRRLGSISYGTITRAVLAAALFVPLFFQLPGTIFRDPESLIGSGTGLTRLPIPISIPACLVGLVLLWRGARSYRDGRFAVASLVLILLAMMVSSGGTISKEQLKLAAQFFVPMAAFVLGRAYLSRESDGQIFYKILLVVVLLVVPGQLLATWMKHSVMLKPDLYLFRVYQHLQYVPVILVGGYLLSLFGLWHVRKYRLPLTLLAPLMGIYTAASMSMLGIGLMYCGMVLFALCRRPFRFDSRRVLLCLVVILTSAVYVERAKTAKVQDGSNTAFSEKFSIKPDGAPSEEFPRAEFEMADGLPPVPLHSVAVRATAGTHFLQSVTSGLWTEVSVASRGVPRNLSERFYYWNFYLMQSTVGIPQFLFGHPRQLDIRLYPSGHNYYLDFLYHFGFVALVPMICLLAATLSMTWRCRSAILDDPELLGLTFVVLYLLLVDNSFKVGMRLPYSGTMTFFFWGFFLSRLSLRREKQAVRRLGGRPADDGLEPEHAVRNSSTAFSQTAAALTKPDAA